MEKEIQNVGAHEDEPKIPNDQFLRNEDPLNSTTTLNFKNVMRSTDAGGKNDDHRQKQAQQMNIQAPHNEEYLRDEHDRTRTQVESPEDMKNQQMDMRTLDKEDIKFIDDRLGG